MHIVEGEERKEARGVEGEERPDGITEHDNEVRVLRSEEELRVGTREREAGAVRVRKTVRTERESVEVPTRHEEVSVERVPLSGEASEAEIGEDEADLMVTEEEVVVSKRPVVTEEIRIRKDVVEDTELVEEDVRRVEIDVEETPPATETSRAEWPRRRFHQGGKAVTLRLPHFLYSPNGVGEAFPDGGMRCPEWCAHDPPMWPFATYRWEDRPRSVEMAH